MGWKVLLLVRLRQAILAQTTKLTYLGSSAAAWQASAGTVAARGIFAHLQSAAMGGYGVPVVNGITKGVAAVAQAVRIGVALGKVQGGKAEACKPDALGQNHGSDEAGDIENQGATTDWERGELMTMVEKSSGKGENQQERKLLQSKL